MVARRPSSPRRLTAILIVIAVAAIRAMPAQVRPGTVVEFAVEQEVRDRWMHGRQQSRFTPFASFRRWMFVDSLRSGPGDERRLYLTLGRFTGGRDSAVVVFRADGRVAHVTASARPPALPPSVTAGDAARTARVRFFSNGRLTLPESRLWDLVPTFRAAPARSGARWVDTLAHEADVDGFRQTLRGVRVTTIIGDTTIGGRQLWVVRDNARVHYEERSLEEEHTVAASVTVSRTVEGVVRGQHLYDSALRLFRTRNDTTLLSGVAELRYPNEYSGRRTFSTPARYERYRHWSLHDNTAYSARLAELQALAQRQGTGMVFVPTTELERRLAAGDSVARDSLLAEWRSVDDADRSEIVFRLLNRWASHDTRFRERVDSIRVAAGDTSYLYSLLERRAFGWREAADTLVIQSMLAFMKDPGLAFAFGQSRDVLYENLRQGFTTWPPAVTRDTARWPCTPAACRLLAEQWRTASEPRLRELGLVALMAQDPARWSDTVIARAQAGSRFLDPAAMLARGVASTWPAALKAPMPAPNAAWETWADWMNGVDPRYAATRANRPGLPPEPRIRFEQSHATALRFFQARTGRDVISELRQSFDAAPSDSARLAFGTMLQGLGELPLTAAELAEYFESGEAWKATLARRALMEMFRGGQVATADSATAGALLDRLVTLVVQGLPAWRTLDGAPTGRARSGPELHSANRGTVFLLADSMPPALREKWKDRVGIVTAAEWERRPLTEASVLYTLSRVRRVGPFVLVGVGASERLARAAGQAPRLYAAMTRYYLMERNGEWVVVASDGWVT